MHRAKRVLFLCDGNVARAKMAEALGTALGRGSIECTGAGTENDPVDPLAIAAMDEIGIHVRAEPGATVDKTRTEDFDFVIRLCDRTDQAMSSAPEWQEYIRWSFGDPAVLNDTDEAKLRAYRRVRDEIRQRIQLFLLANRLMAKTRVPLRLVSGL
jgi:arsenate reductase